MYPSICLSTPTFQFLCVKLQNCQSYFRNPFPSLFLSTSTHTRTPFFFIFSSLSFSVRYHLSSRFTFFSSVIESAPHPLAVRRSSLPLVVRRPSPRHSPPLSSSQVRFYSPLSLSLLVVLSLFKFHVSLLQFMFFVV